MRPTVSAGSAAPGGSGRWHPLTLDAVLVYAQAGSGRRAGLFTDYTFAVWRGEELVPVAKAYSGLTEQEIAALDRWIRANTIDRFGPVRQVEAVHVFELAFEGIARSTRHKSGVALRFPRIARWRTDKPAAQADRLEQVHALLPERRALCELIGASRLTPPSPLRRYQQVAAWPATVVGRRGIRRRPRREELLDGTRRIACRP